MGKYVARPYEVKFRTREKITTSKFYTNRSDRNREAARLRELGTCLWVKEIDH